jgi:hypothetical protein
VSGEEYLVRFNKARTSNRLTDRCHQASPFISKLSFTLFDLSEVGSMGFRRALEAHTSNENVSLSKKSFKSASLHNTG